MIARLRTWWAASPRARRLPGALTIPAILIVVGTLAGLATVGLFHWLFLACAVAGGGFGIYTTLLVLTGRDAL
jgi:bacteriorhodopsin